ncbi:hypothetical protein GJ744_001985 [Endocarpon pusillum]|uniref:C2H2-type domain-containing protein n=1 Tax=Endocarpon pusillum TaxID=364733 RepID=A0A8H7AB15_9EURO|nr:hypothetical protein GJ744_001985 [Endocarpon pusillum]
MLQNADIGMLNFAHMPASTFPTQLQYPGQPVCVTTSGVDYEFLSGSRPLEPSGVMAALPRAIEEPDEASEESSLKCNFPGCRSKATFKRNYELQRHMKKHTRKETFDCPAINCKYRGTKAFYRADKLKAHVDLAHDGETLFACPVAGCLSARTPLSGAILALHIRNHDNGSCAPYWVYLKALENCGERRTCPVGNCSKKVHQDSLHQHLLQHTQAERTAFRTEIAAMGFDAENGYVICPIPSCQIFLTHLPAFHDHLIDHISVDPNHLRTWRYEVSSLVRGDPHPWLEWRAGNEIFDLTCSACGQRVKGKRITHQLDLLKDLEELRECREQILQHCPGFGLNPIFDDVMPVIRRKSERAP